MEMGLWDKSTRTPGGRLEAAGVWPGDIPIETHGGLWAFRPKEARTEARSLRSFARLFVQASWDGSFTSLSASVILNVGRP